jgi:hypothetical protein
MHTSHPLFIVAVALIALRPFLVRGKRVSIALNIGGAFLVLLGVASALPDWSSLASTTLGFRTVASGLFIAGMIAMLAGGPPVYLFHAPVTAPRSWNRSSFFSALGSIAVLAAVFAAFDGLARAAGRRALFAALGILGALVILWLLIPLARIPHAIKWLDQRWLAPKREPHPCLERRGRIIAWSTIGVALLVLLIVDHLFAAVAATLAAAVASHRLALDAGHAPKLPVVPIIAGLSLLTYLALISNIAGSEIGLGYPTILETPFSLRAEAMLALILGAGLWALLGLWPFHGAGPGSALAIVAGLVLTQWGTRILPMGILHAAPLFAAVAAIAAFHAAATGRVGEYVAALGVLAVVAGVPQSWILFALASVLALHRLSGKPSPIPGIERRELGGIALIPILAFLLPGMLLGETVLTVAAVFAGVALFWPAKEN